MDESIDYQAVVAQLQAENEHLRERLVQAHTSSTLDDTIEGLVLVIKQSDPMKLYVYVCIACIILSVCIQLLEVLLK